MATAAGNPFSDFEVGSPRGRVKSLQRTGSIELSSSDEELKNATYKFNSGDKKKGAAGGLRYLRGSSSFREEATSSSLWRSAGAASHSEAP